MKNSQNKNIQEEIKKVERKRLICKIGTNYYYGSVNLTYPIWEIIQETKEQRDKEMHKECEKSINEAIIRQRNLDMKMFKEAIEKVLPKNLKEIVDSLTKKMDLPKNFVFTEEQFYWALNYIKQELLKEVCGEGK